MNSMVPISGNLHSVSLSWGFARFQNLPKYCPIDSSIRPNFLEFLSWSVWYVIYIYMYSCYYYYYYYHHKEDDVCSRHVWIDNFFPNLWSYLAHRVYPLPAQFRQIILGNLGGLFALGLLHLGVWFSEFYGGWGRKMVCFGMGAGLFGLFEQPKSDDDTTYLRSIYYIRIIYIHKNYAYPKGRFKDKKHPQDPF